MLERGEDPHLPPDRFFPFAAVGGAAGKETLQRVLAAGRLLGHQPDGAAAAAAPEATADVVSGNLGRGPGGAVTSISKE